MEDYEVLSIIGKGSFGQVKKIKRKSDDKILVWKELNYGKMSEREKTQLVSEVNIIRELKHQHIVRYYDRIIDKKAQKIYIIMEYCEGGDLSQLLKKCKKDKDYIAEDVIWKIITQIFLALYECHNRKAGKIFHRDLKPANIFLDAQNNIKLGDFGLARVMGEHSVFAQTHVGTPYYMSPEQINETSYDEKSDIWSAGCLIYELAALKPPFQAQNHLSLAIKIKTGVFERLPIRYSEDLQNLIKTMVNIDTSSRPSIDQLLKMPQIDLRQQEKKLRDRHAQVKKKEQDLKEKEEMIKKQLELLEQKENELEKFEIEIRKKEEQMEEDKENSHPNNTITQNIQSYQTYQMQNENVKNNDNVIRKSLGDGLKKALENENNINLPLKNFIQKSNNGLLQKSNSIKSAQLKIYNNNDKNEQKKNLSFKE